MISRFNVPASISYKSPSFYMCRRRTFFICPCSSRLNGLIQFRQKICINCIILLSTGKTLWSFTWLIILWNSYNIHFRSSFKILFFKKVGNFLTEAAVQKHDLVDVLWIQKILYSILHFQNNVFNARFTEFVWITWKWRRRLHFKCATVTAVHGTFRP